MKNHLRLGNRLFSLKQYDLALKNYYAALENQPELANLIELNIRLAKKRLDQAVSQTGRQKTQQPQHTIEQPASSAYKVRIEEVNNSHVVGWCVNRSEPSAKLECKVFLDGHILCSTLNTVPRPDLKKAGLSNGLGGIRFQNPGRYLPGGIHTLTLLLPDGTLSPSFDVEGGGGKGKSPSILTPFPPRPLTIIVPIFNAADDLQSCINRLLAHTPSFAKFLFIDDCSTDGRIREMLAIYKNTTGVKILHNQENLGFTRTVNLGIAEAGSDDVILLNSDARVTPGWLEGMLIAAHSAPRIATVTAMSDRAGAFSAPQIGNDNKLPEGVDEITYAREFRRCSLGLYPRVPTGNGFCMFVSRACISSIGSFDAHAFPRGYGEENDFCMRALRAGWSNVIDDRTYVFHDRSKSFGEAKTELLAAGRAAIDARYPEYRQAIQVFSDSAEIALARNRAHLAMQNCADKVGSSWIPRVLFVVATQTGGTPQTNLDLMETLSNTVECWMLRCDSKILELSRMADDGRTSLLRSHELLEPVDPLTHSSSEYDNVVLTWMQEFDFELLHIRHLGWHGLSLPHLARQLGMKVVFSFHDFYVLSSTVKLIDDAGIFLGNTFDEEGSPYRESLWPKDALPTPRGGWLAFWREKFQAALEHCDAFVTTSRSARQLILDAMPRLQPERFVVIPHGRDFHGFARIRQKPKDGEPIRILVPGHINAVKGLEVIRALTEHDKAGRLRFYILGRLVGERPRNNVVELGPYERKDFAERSLNALPHLGIIFSIWDETYCHTLTELWSVGLPAAVLDFPNVSARVRQCGAGWVLDHHDIPKLYQDILRLAFDEEEYQRTEQALSDWQAGYGLANSNAQMAASYLNIFSEILREEPRNKQALSPFSRKRIGVVCPASADLRRAPGSTHIRIWERTRNTVERNVTYIKMTPETLIASAREKMLDGCIIQRNAIPQDLVETMVTSLAKTRILYAMELDDDLLDVPTGKDPSGIYHSYAPDLRTLIASACAVTVSTPPLEEKIRTIQNNVVILANHLSDRLWRAAPHERKMDGAIRAIYMGSESHHDDLMLVLPALDAVAEIYPQFRLSLIGVSSQKDAAIGRAWLEIMEIPNRDYVNFVPWLRQQTNQFDFAIAPLSETNFNDCKSDLKLLEYAALGLPVIASDVSVYRSAAAPCVRLARNETEQWIGALSEQIEFGQENQILGKRFRQWVLRERMLSSTLPGFDNFLLGIFSGLDKND